MTPIAEQDKIQERSGHGNGAALSLYEQDFLLWSEDTDLPQDDRGWEQTIRNQPSALERSPNSATSSVADRVSS